MARFWEGKRKVESDGEHRQAAAEDYGSPAQGDTPGARATIAGLTISQAGTVTGISITSAGGHPAQNSFAPQQGLGNMMGGFGSFAGGGGGGSFVPHGPMHQALIAQQLAAQGMLWTSASVGPGGSIVPAQSVAPPKLANGGIQVGEIIAWRWWECDQNGYLRSCTNQTLWPTTEALKASAEPNGAGPGIYAFRTEQDAINDRAGPILGRVALWGTVVEYERGYTAEYAKIVGIDRWMRYYGASVGSFSTPTNRGHI